MSNQTPNPDHDETTTAQRRSVRPMAFSSPTTAESTTAPANAETAADAGTAGEPDWTASSAQQPEQSANETGSSQESSPATSRGASRKALADAIAVVLDALSNAAHQLATDEFGKEAGLYLTDDQDRDGISKPAAAVLARRGVLEGAGSDVTDIVQLGIAVAGYASKQLRKLRGVRAARKAVAGYSADVADPELAAAHG